MVRFQLSQFPDLRPLADRVGADGEGRGGLVREVRRLVRLGMALESVGIGSRELQALMDGALQLVPTGARAALVAPQPVAPLIPDAGTPTLRTAHTVAAVRHDERPARQAATEQVTGVLPDPAPARKSDVDAPDRQPVSDPVLDAFVV